MTTDELRAFCNTGSEHLAVQAPFSLDEWTYATDGSIIVRVPRLPEVAELPNGLLSPHELFAYTPPGQIWYPVPTLPPAPMAVPCSRCDGTLIERRDEEPPVEFGPALFAPKYIRLLAALPHCEIAPSSANDVCRVRFDGGDGLVMPMRRYW